MIFMGMGNISRGINEVRYGKKKGPATAGFPTQKNKWSRASLQFAVQPIFPPWGRTLKLNLGQGWRGEAQHLFPLSKLLSPEKARLLASQHQSSQLRLPSKGRRQTSNFRNNNKTSNTSRPLALSKCGGSSGRSLKGENKKKGHLFNLMM